MSVRVPAIVDAVAEKNPDYPASIRDELARLSDALRENGPFPPLASSAAGADVWQRELLARTGQSWLSTDWFFAETYAYRQVAERVRFWETGRDPFLPTKMEEYASPAHAEAFEQALALEGSVEERLSALFGLSLFGNRIDLSFAASLDRGTESASEDLVSDERDAALRLLRTGLGPLHVVCDNAGTELTLDLALVDAVLAALSIGAVLHVKVHPTFVSDATREDVLAFLGLGSGPPRFVPRFAAGKAALERLRDAVQSGRIAIEPHPFWNGPLSLWEMPAALEREIASARLVVLKGDANYRRAVNDALWPPETPFSLATGYFPAPLFALRTFKSDPIVGLPAGLAETLDRDDPSWRVNGKRGVASLGGRRV